MQSLTPNDKQKFSVVTNAYSQDKRISEKISKVSKVSQLSLSDMGEYNEAEKERILALLEEQ